MSPTIPKPLLDEIAAGRCLPFVGAGFSLNARLPNGLHMPDWRGLTEILAQAANVSPDLRGPDVASAFERKFGRVQLVESIRRALHVDEAKTGDSHRALATLPFDTIYTTNFDLLLEDAYASLGRPYRSLVGESQMPFHGGPFMTSIVKMHGDLRHEEHMIITQDDYDRYLAEYPITATHLSAMLITKTPLFVGYSRSDLHFQHIRDIVRSRLGKFERMAYLIQFDIKPSDVEAMLADNLHVISIRTGSRQPKDAKLAELFQSIQQALDVQEGAKLRAIRSEIFEPIAPDKLEMASRARDASSLLTSSSNLCFVIMPLAPELDVVYRTLIRPAAEQFGLEVLRANDILQPGAFTEQIRAAIQQARLCIADLSDRNPNVQYEVGIAHSLGKPMVLLSKRIEDIPFDLRSTQVIVYDLTSLETARLALERSIQHALGQDRLDEAKRLIKSGMYRAGVAMLGVLLEHSLRQLSAKYPSKVDAQMVRRSRSLGETIRILTRSGVIGREDSSRLRGCVDIRNRAVHELEEPTAEDSDLMLRVVERFIDEYLGSDFAGDVSAGSPAG
jgi:hypothetical protein